MTHTLANMQINRVLHVPSPNSVHDTRTFKFVNGKSKVNQVLINQKLPFA